MDDEQGLLGTPDPAWAKRIAKIEKKFVKAEKRQAAVSGSRHAPRGVRAAYICGAVIVLLLVIAAVARPFGDRSAVAGSTVVNVNGGPYPTGSAGAAARARGTSSSTAATSPTPEVSAGDPFAGTPAATWRTGDVGVVMPAATALGPYSAEQVEAGLDQARRYILTARTEHSVLVDHRLETLEALLDPREVAANHDGAVGPNSYLSPTLLAPGFMLAAPPRVNGAVTVTHAGPTESTRERHLVVSANLVWAYPLVPHADTRLGTGTLAILHEHLTLDVVPAVNGSGKLRIESEDSFEANVDCGYMAQGLIALPRVDDPSLSPTTSGTIPTGTQVYDTGTPMTMGKTCR